MNDPPEIVGPTDVDFPENSADAVAEYTVEGVDAGETAHWKPLSGTRASEFSLTSTGDDPAELRFNSPPDYESFDTGNDEHIFLLTIMVEVGGEMKTEHVRVEVTNVNEPPSFATATTTRNVGENAEGGETIGAPVEATDPDKNDYLDYTLTGDDDDTSFDIDYLHGQLRTISGVDYGTKSSYTVTVTATDQGGLTDTITVTITTNEENDAPVFSGGSSTATREVAENSPADTNVGDPISATDEDQDTLTYSLAGEAAEQTAFNDAFQLNTSTGQITVKANDSLNFEDKASYTFDIGVSDNNGGTATINVTINVTDVNEVPTFDDGASTTRTVIENTAAGENIGAPVAATDPDNENNPNTQTLTYTLGGTDAASFDFDTSSGQLLTKAALDHDTKAAYTVTVSVRDSKDASGNADSAEDDTITVTITLTGENEAPEFDANLVVTLQVQEDTPANTNIGGPITATDPDVEDTLTYTLGSASAPVFDIDASGQLKTKAALDFETKPSYTVTVTATDGSGATDTIDVTIDVTNVDEDGTVTFDPTQPEAGTPLTAELTDPDGTTTSVTWQWSMSATSNGTFDPIAGGTMSSYTPVAADIGKYLRATASYTDPEDPGKTAEGTTTVGVTPSNTHPTFPDVDNNDVSDPKTFNVPENSTANTVVGTVSADESDTDDILTYSLDGTHAQVDAFNAAFLLGTSTGEITVQADDSLDHETTDAYTFDIGVSNKKDAAGTLDNVVDSTVAVTINVTDVNEPPAFATETDTRTVPEDTAAGENIGAPFTATDPDEDATLTYTLDTDGAAVFDIDASGQLKTEAGLNFEAKSSYTVTVSVRDSKDADGNTDTATDDTITVTIDVTNVNEAPEFPSSETGTRNVVENTAANIAIGNPVAAADPDGDELTYTLGGTDAGSFNFVATSGQLRTKDALDKETKSSYTVTVSVRDSKDASGAADTAPDDTITVTITVTGENEPPEFASETDTREIAENTAAGQAIGLPVAATDPDDGDTLTYKLDAASDAVFDIIDDSGQLKTEAALDFETKPSYTVTVTATDGSGATDTIDVTIDVTNIDEDGTVTLNPTQPNPRLARS